MEKQTVKKQKVFLSLEQLYLSIFAIILSLEEAAMVHGIDADLLVEKINAAMTAAGK